MELAEASEADLGTCPVQLIKCDIPFHCIALRRSLGEAVAHEHEPTSGGCRQPSRRHARAAAAPSTRRHTRPVARSHTGRLPPDYRHLRCTHYPHYHFPADLTLAHPHRRSRPLKLPQKRDEGRPGSVYQKLSWHCKALLGPREIGYKARIQTKINTLRHRRRAHSRDFERQCRAARASRNKEKKPKLEIKTSKLPAVKK